MKLIEIDRIERQRKLIKQRRPQTQPPQPLFGVLVKEWDKESKLFSLCGECIKSIEPPTRMINEGISATRFCDWCDVANVKI